MKPKNNLDRWETGLVSIGDRYGRYTVLSTYRQAEKPYRYMALCRCDCGKDPSFVRVDHLRSGHTQSCGCFHIEQITTHGEWRNPLFNVWRGIMSRCYNPFDKRFSRYGGRGISVCSEWHSVNAFIDDMAEGYSPELQIDRTNNDGNYEKSNCRWATRSQQSINRSDRKRYEYNGESLTLSEWSKKVGIDTKVLWDRINRGWSAEKALVTPLFKKVI